MSGKLDGMIAALISTQSRGARILEAIHRRERVALVPRENTFTAAAAP